MPIPTHLDQLRDVATWANSNAQRAGSVPLTVVLPSGRSRVSTSGHLALASDALYTFEFISALQSLLREAGAPAADVRSCLDIDFYENLIAGRRTQKSVATTSVDSLVESHLLVIGTADISIAAKLLLEESKAASQSVAGYRKPFEDCILRGARGKIYGVQAYPTVGALGLYENPWSSEERVALFAGGLLASGTLAATALLSQYMRGLVQGNNTHAPNSPVRIVAGRLREYWSTELVPVDDCTPQHDVRNIQDSLHLLE